MKIIGIDPGYERLGIAVIEKGTTDTLCYSNCFKTPADIPFSKRLLMLGEELERLIVEYAPGALGIESLIFNNNQKTAMRVAEVRGLIIYLAEKHGLSIHEFTPLQIKDAIIGYGRATKAQIALMIPKLVRLEKEIRSDDEFDAIAVALTASACIRK